MSKDVFELVNEAREMMKDNQAFMDELSARQTLIDGYTQQLEDAQKAGIKSAEQYYQGKIDELRMKEGEKDFDRYITRGEMGKAADGETEAIPEGKVGYSSDYYKKEMARALENGNKVAYENAKRHWGEEVANEETKKIKP